MSAMRVTLLLCDAAQVADGKLYILGGGWSLIGPDPTPSAVAMKVDVDWTEVDRLHHWELFLVDEDGQPIVAQTPDGPQPIEVRGDFEVSRPESVPEGSPVDVALGAQLRPAADRTVVTIHLATLDRRRDPGGLGPAVFDPRPSRLTTSIPTGGPLTPELGRRGARVVDAIRRWCAGRGRRGTGCRGARPAVPWAVLVSETMLAQTHVSRVHAALSRVLRGPRPRPRVTPRPWVTSSAPGWAGL